MDARNGRNLEPNDLAETPSAALENLLAVYRKWYYLPDPGPLVVALATVVANRFAGTPLWILVVGPPGGGKTDILNSVVDQPDVWSASTLTEASLLSGTPQKEKHSSATGGLLRQVGEAGTLLFKDFGSVLSMNNEARSQVLAALREIYDGKWDRLVGTDGGRTLTWTGKLGFLGGATSSIDEHHGVMSALGERFLFYRLEIDNREELGRRSLEHQGRHEEMRSELREAVADFFAALGKAERLTFTGVEKERLVSLASLVARARSPVIRHRYTREIELVPDPEAPGRLVDALGLLLSGLQAIGAHPTEAWRVATKAALDSMKTERLRVVDLLTRRPEHLSLVQIATELELPSPLLRRTAEDLEALKVLARRKGDNNKTDLWAATESTRRLHSAGVVQEETAATNNHRRNLTASERRELGDKVGRVRNGLPQREAAERSERG